MSKVNDLPVAVAQPMVPVAQAVPIQATPMAQAVPMQATSMAMASGMATGMRIGQWKTQPCDCCSDCCTCCAQVWCSCITIPQIFVRVTKQKQLFCALFSVFLVLQVVYGIFGNLYSQKYMELFSNLAKYAPELMGECLRAGNLDCYDDEMKMYYYVYSVAGLVLTVLTTVIVMKARKRIRERDSIAGDDCQDCCVSFWPCIAPCTMCQMMRHEGLGNGKYQLCSADGSPPGHENV